MGWLTTTDHKRIGILYMVTTFVFFILGGTEALMIRLQLGVADNDLVTPEVYNQLFTMHGTTMIFLFVVPMMAGFANYFVPLMIGARDMAFPRLNALSFWLLLAGGIVFYASIFWNPPEAGWIEHVPLANVIYSPVGRRGRVDLPDPPHRPLLDPRGDQLLRDDRQHACAGHDVVAAAAVRLGDADVRGPDHRRDAGDRGAVTMLLLDRHFGTHFFDPRRAARRCCGRTCSGSSAIRRSTSWSCPAFGIVSEVLPVFARKPIFGYKAIAASTVLIAFLGFLTWLHHMFTTPIPIVVLIFAMIASFLIAVPTGVKIFNWIGTLWQGSIEFRTPLLFASGSSRCSRSAGSRGVFLAIFPVDWQLNDTYFIVAHIHFVLVGGSVFGIFAAIYYWFPKITGRMLSEGSASWSSG